MKRSWPPRGRVALAPCGALNVDLQCHRPPGALERAAQNVSPNPIKPMGAPPSGKIYFPKARDSQNQPNCFVDSCGRRHFSPLVPN
jgi:hypothetical protein